ncbi:MULTISPECIES: mechanosensitive channel MscK [Pseudomonas]|uniref:Mechanosensitive channel MscK n=2 Tax=Pseudomonas TaxID=286 RepID=A0ABS0KH28_PSENT|nr:MULTISPECIES: mechanosensitive channel MscK [Pseudomonas]MBG6287253.1 mechanosensitive channel MscK [Pseudomonas nitroreducens]MDG9854424.1 mechanosensitive channel MscK [Pseudomonas nitroreducens]MDH1072189.1 mechanosensitive channel MscK [Pseudomonas nitroreducens]NMZ60620.1 mechanosensitive channel MscK [Pseudomonas nitroreducens]NMZ71770.1 mechanosensitive channel MscK [Pseudomonas nitroreducens]
MSFLLRTFLTAVLLCGAFTGLPAQAADTTVPSAEKVQQSLDGLADRKLPEADAKALKATLENTLKLLAAKTDAEQQLQELNGKLADAPKLINENQKALSRLKGSSDKPASQRYAGFNATQLEMTLNEQSTQLAAWQKELVDAKSDILTAQTRPERAQADLSKNQTRLLEIAGILKAGKDGSKTLSEEHRNELLAEQALLTAQNPLLRKQLAGNNLLLDLASSQRDLLAERIGREERETLELQTMISDKRREQSEQTVAKLSKDTDQAAGTDSLLSQQSATNLKLSDYLLRTTDRLNTLTRRNLEAKQQLDNLTQGEQALDEQINVLRGSLLLSKILYQQKQSLPVIKTDQDLADEIADLRLYQFELNQKRDEINNTQLYIDNLLAQQAQESVTPQLRHDLNELVNTRLELMERLNHELNALLNEAITLQLNQKQLKETSDSLRATLDEQMFWIPSNRPLDLSWFKMTPTLLHHQLAEVPWGSGVQELFEGLIDRPFLFLPLLLLVAGLLWKRKFLYDKLESLNDDIGHFKRDSQAHTPLALLLAVLLALPGTLALAIAGLALLLDARGQNATLGSALLEMAQVWLVFYTAHRILRPGGIAERHFHWSQSQVQFLGKLMRRLGLVVMSLVAVVTVAEHSPASLADDVIGIAVVLFGYGAMTWLLAQLLFNSPSSERPSMIKMVVGLGFTALPVALFLAVGFGYYYTALKLTDRLIDTLFLLMFWMVVEATFVRGMGVAARRLAYQRALAKRQNAPKEGIEGSEVVVEEPTLGIEQINEQSMRLIRLGLLIGFVVTLYWVWADLISVVSYLDNVTLYQYTSGTGDAASTTPISLSDFLMAMVIAAVTVALARNLPGLLEVLVLQRLTLAQGSAYAITTLLSYTISGIGFVSALSTLGVSWDKLQWLVAALSVGLGFGLQAIFSNFVSGLIILFERPVRIGDVVTIGTLSGTVSRIRIRATTITDFDRKEIIVPNQTFITGQLVNWSLSDTVTRVTIKIGLAYESDLPLARKIMLDAAHANPRILRDPEPVLYFTTISASTFDYELRFHVRELGDRNPAVDETLTRIALAFREAGIDMAFNQVDVFLKNFQGQEAQVIVGQQQPTATPVKISQDKPNGDKA